MIISFVSKIISESLLSLYPIFVKKIQLSIGLQLWSRFFTYVIISFLFIDWVFIGRTLFSINGLLLSFVTILHVFFSYRGFQILESGIAYVCFYTYPIMILLLSGEPLNSKTYLYLFVVFLGIVFLYFDFDFERKKDQPKTKLLYGFVMILLAAFTEALIYFIVNKIQTTNNWNHLFISYFFGAIFFTIYYLFVGEKVDFRGETFTLSLFLNFGIGLFGYLLRFYSISRLPTKIYASLSYVGILMAFIYGVVFNSEQITILKIIGSFFIMIPVYFLSI